MCRSRQRACARRRVTVVVVFAIAHARFGDHSCLVVPAERSRGPATVCTGGAVRGGTGCNHDGDRWGRFPRTCQTRCDAGTELIQHRKCSFRPLLGSQQSPWSTTAHHWPRVRGGAESTDDAVDEDVAQSRKSRRRPAPLRGWGTGVKNDRRAMGERIRAAWSELSGDKSDALGVEEAQGSDCRGKGSDVGEWDEKGQRCGIGGGGGMDGRKRGGGCGLARQKRH